jgi:hypothetical protein
MLVSYIFIASYINKYIVQKCVCVCVCVCRIHKTYKSNWKWEELKSVKDQLPKVFLGIAIKEKYDSHETISDLLSCRWTLHSSATTDNFPT